MNQKKKKLNKPLLISFVIGAAYLIYLISYFTSVLGSTSGAEQAGAALATALITPHMICILLAVIFNGVGVFFSKRGFALTGAILYSVALVLFLPYFMFVIIEIVLSFIGTGQLKKKSRKEELA